MDRKGTPASPATALASRVLPVPGGPTSSTPLGMRAPREIYFLGSFRNSTISWSSSFSSSAPATSSKVVFLSLSVSVRVWAEPNLAILSGPMPPPWALATRKYHISPKTTATSRKGSSSSSQLVRMGSG